MLVELELRRRGELPAECGEVPAIAIDTWREDSAVLYNMFDESRSKWNLRLICILGNSSGHSVL